MLALTLLLILAGAASAVPPQAPPRQSEIGPDVDRGDLARIGQPGAQGDSGRRSSSGCVPTRSAPNATRITFDDANRFTFQALSARQALGWTQPAGRWTPDSIGPEPQLLPPAFGDDLPTLTQIRTVLYSLFEAGTRTAQVAFYRHQMLVSNCLKIEKALDVASPAYRRTFSRACAAALPAALQRQSSDMAAADDLLAEIVATLVRLFEGQPLEAKPADPAACAPDAKMIVRKWCPHVPVLDGGVEVATEQLSANAAILITAALLVRHSGHHGYWQFGQQERSELLQISSSFQPELCAELTVALREHPDPIACSPLRVPFAANLFAEMARRFMQRNDAVRAYVRGEYEQYRKHRSFGDLAAVVLMYDFHDALENVQYCHNTSCFELLDGLP